MNFHIRFICIFKARLHTDDSEAVQPEGDLVVGQPGAPHAAIPRGLGRGDWREGPHVLHATPTVVQVWIHRLDINIFGTMLAVCYNLL